MGANQCSSEISMQTTTTTTKKTERLKWVSVIEARSPTVLGKPLADIIYAAIVTSTRSIALIFLEYQSISHLTATETNRFCQYASNAFRSLTLDRMSEAALTFSRYSAVAFVQFPSSLSPPLRAVRCFSLSLPSCGCSRFYLSLPPISTENRLYSQSDITHLSRRMGGNQGLLASLLERDRIRPRSVQVLPSSGRFET